MRNEWMRGFLPVLLLICACGSEPEPDPAPIEITTVDEPEPDPATTPEPVTPLEEPACDQWSPPEVLEFSPGGLVRLDFEGVELVSMEAPAGWSVPAPGLLRASYDADPTNVAVTVTCEGGSASASIILEPRAWKWQLLSEDGPAAREHTVMWIDTSDPDSLYLYGGYLYEPVQFTASFDMWRLDLSTNEWTEVQQEGDVPLTTAGEIAPTKMAATSLYVGGTAADGSMPFGAALVEVTGDTALWTTVETSDGPGLQLGALVFDARRDRQLLVSGLADLGDGMRLLPFEVGLLFDVGTAEPSRSPVEVLEFPDAPMPSSRYGAAWALDPIADRLVVFSGAQWPTASEPVNAASDAWALDLSSDAPRWAEIVPGGDAAVGRRNACHVYDPLGHRLFVFGGTADGRTSVRGLHVLALDAGAERWTTLEVAPDGAPPRASCTGVYDSARHRVLFGFGNSEAAVYSDVWALEL